MTSILVSHHFAEHYGESVAQIAVETGLEYDFITLPADPEGRLDDEDCARADIAFFTGDIFPDYSRGFFSATARATNLRWMHLFNAGVDNPVFRDLLERGVRLTTSSGSTAKPIAQTAIGGMLMLARRFPQWGDSQRRHAWEPIRDNMPPDLDSQTMVVLGPGAIGNEIARLARAIGLRVIGVRRSPGGEGDHVDSMVTPAELVSVLPQADWLAIACPLTNETRGIIDAAALSAMPRGAHVINIARGEVVDEPALIEALRSGQIGGAYLDVVSQEPLPAESPLWDMPNVIISPHNSSIAAGNEGRTVEYFLTNLRAWATGGEMVNEVRA